MSTTTSQDDQPGQATTEESPPAPWLRASSADLVGLDFEAPLAESKSADASELSDRYRAAMSNVGTDASKAESPADRVFAMLAAVTGMHFKPHERNELRRPATHPSR